jgi:DNA polymerase III delta subunit
MAKVKFPFALDVAEDWFLGADSQQWIIYRKRTANGKSLLVGQSFFGSEKALLVNTINNRYKIALTDEAREKIDSLPDRFLVFYELYKPKSGKGRKKKVLTDD